MNDSYCENDIDVHNAALLDVMAYSEVMGDVLPAWIGSFIMPYPPDVDPDEEKILDHNLHLAGDRLE